MSPEPVDIFVNKPHFGILAMCLSCQNRWIAYVISKTSLFSLECPECKRENSFASFIPTDYFEEFNS